MVKFNRWQRFQNIRQPSGDDIDFVRGGNKLQHSGELQEMKSIKKT